MKNLFTGMLIVATLLILAVATIQLNSSFVHAASTLVQHTEKTSCHHHLTPGFNHIIDGDIPAYDVFKACNVHRNDVYQVIFSDPCMHMATETNLVADNEGRLSFAVLFEECDPDIYVVTLRDISPNHAKYHAVVLVDAA